MAETKNGIYKVFNGTDWDTINLASSYRTTAVTADTISFIEDSVVTSGKNMLEWNVGVGNKANTTAINVYLNNTLITEGNCGGFLSVYVKAIRTSSTAWLFNYDIRAQFGGWVGMETFSATEITTLKITTPSGSPMQGVKSIIQLS